MGTNNIKKKNGKGIIHFELKIHFASSSQSMKLLRVRKKPFIVSCTKNNTTDCFRGAILPLVFTHKQA